MAFTWINRIVWMIFTFLVLLLAMMGVLLKVHADHELFDVLAHEHKMKIVADPGFEVFLSGEHIPTADAQYAIERKEKEDLLKAHLIQSTLTTKAFNIVCDREMGKSYLLKKVANTIKPPHKVFYIDGAMTLREYLADYQWNYDTELDVIKQLFRSIKRYKNLHPNEKLIVILDSPGGITEDNDKYTEYTLDFLIKGMKTAIANNEASFYCVSSSSQNIFTEKRVHVFGSGRFREIEQNDWINLSLTTQEREDLMSKYQQDNKMQFHQDTINALRKGNITQIGVFIDEMSNRHNKVSLSAKITSKYQYVLASSETK